MIGCFLAEKIPDGNAEIYCHFGRGSMATSFSVRVVRSDGEPRHGVRVAADFGLLDGIATEYSDSDGWATFELSGNYVSAEIYVDGESQGTHPVSDGETFSFTVDPD